MKFKPDFSNQKNIFKPAIMPFQQVRYARGLHCRAHKKKREAAFNWLAYITGTL